MSDIKNKLSQSVGALSGLSKKNSNDNDSSNKNDNVNHNSNNNINDVSDVSSSGNTTLEDRIREIKSKANKRKIKNVTYGLYEDQQESIKEITDALGMGINEFMRESADMIIDIFNDKLKD